MLCLAFFYMAQGAVFLGVVQIVVYTGAVMMLFLFVLMLIGIESQDSLTETIRGQRWLAVPFVIAFGAVLLGVYAHANLPAFIGTDAADAKGGGNVPGLAELLFSRYYWAFEVSSAVLITAAVGAMVLTHRERTVPRKSQRELSIERFERWGKGERISLTGLPNPGVYAQHNAVDTPALLPDGSPSEVSVNATLRGRDTVRGFRPLRLPGNGRNGSELVRGDSDNSSRATRAMRRCRSEPGQLPLPVRDAVHHRRARRADPAQRHRRVHVHRADAQRLEPGLRHLLPDARQPRRAGHRLLHDGGRRRRGRRRPGHHHDGLPHPPSASVDDANLLKY
jgi:NADH-quinone oxidoreductase subunit J